MPPTPHPHSAKSIAPWQLHSLKKLRVGCDVVCGIPFRSTPPTPQPQHRKINCTPQICTRRKICMVGCDVRSGVLHAHNSATATPQNQANCSCRKICIRSRNCHFKLRIEKKVEFPNLVTLPSQCFSCFYSLLLFLSAY